MTRYRSYHVAVTSTAPPERVFALLADGAGWASWAGPWVPASSWARSGDPALDGVGAVRALGRWPLVDLEEVTESDPPRRHAYRLVSGLPVRGYVATVDLSPQAGGGTRIDWRARFTPAVPGTGILMLAFTRMVVASIAKHLARAA